MRFQRQQVCNIIASVSKEYFYTSIVYFVYLGKEIPDWQDPELLRDLKAATGVNLEMPKKGKGRTKKKETAEKLANLKVTETSSRKRLEKKVLNK